MKLVDKNILLISPEPWNHIHVSKHHYAKHLVDKGNRVVFLNPPGNNWNVEVQENGLMVIDYPGFWRGLRFLPAFLRRKNQINIFRKIEAMTSLTFDVFWSFDNSVFYDLDGLPQEVTTISHIVDLNMDFQLALTAGTADVCFCSSRYIKRELEKHSNHVFFVNHGFNIGLEPSNYQMSRKSLERIAVGYAGNLDIKYLDWELIKSISSGYPNVDFYFAGSMQSDHIKTYFEQFPNMHHTGVLQSNNIQSFYEEMDMLIITYKADDHREQLANPHKVLEYLYSGKPVVATLTEEYMGEDLLYMSNENSEWPGLFNYVLENLDEVSSKNLVDKRKKFALDNTYDKQIERIEKILASLPTETNT